MNAFLFIHIEFSAENKTQGDSCTCNCTVLYYMSQSKVEI